MRRPFRRRDACPATDDADHTAPSPADEPARSSPPTGSGTAFAADLSIEDNLMICAIQEAAVPQRGVLALGEMRRHGSGRHATTTFAPPATASAAPAVRRQPAEGRARPGARSSAGAADRLAAAVSTSARPEFVYRQLEHRHRRGDAAHLLRARRDPVPRRSIAVMVQGRFLRVLDSAEVTVERLGLLMGGQDVSA